LKYAPIIIKILNSVKKHDKTKENIKKTIQDRGRYWSIHCIRSNSSHSSANRL